MGQVRKNVLILLLFLVGVVAGLVWRVAYVSVSQQSYRIKWTVTHSATRKLLKNKVALWKTNYNVLVHAPWKKFSKLSKRKVCSNRKNSVNSAWGHVKSLVDTVKINNEARHVYL